MRFVLTGTYNSGNKGDAAMELSAVQGIHEQYPGSEVTILSPFPDMDGSFYAPTPVIGCNRRKLITATLDLARGILWRVFGGDWLLSPAMKLVRQADLVVDLSGDMLTEDYGPHVAYSHYIPILRALILGRPYFLCAQSIGPFKLTRPLARFILNHAAAITPRDSITTEYLRRLGVKNTNIQETADLAFLLAPAVHHRVEEILGTEHIVLDDRPLLGVSVSQLIEAKYRTRNPGAPDQDFVSLMKSVIEQIARKHDAQVLFVAHVTGPSAQKDDRIIAQKVRDSLNDDVSAHVLQGDYRPEELKGVIAKCSVFCGARMHANIGALTSHVPTVAISYSHKTPGIMAACGLGESVTAVETMTAESLRSLLEQAFDEQVRMSQQLKERLPELKASAARNVNMFKQLAVSATQAYEAAG